MKDDIAIKKAALKGLRGYAHDRMGQEMCGPADQGGIPDKGSEADSAVPGSPEGVVEPEPGESAAHETSEGPAVESAESKGLGEDLTPEDIALLEKLLRDHGQA